MPRFEYAAREESGQAISGEIVASDRDEAAKMLRAEGKFVVKLVALQDRSGKSKTPAKVGSRRVKEDQVIYFADQLAVMIDTGVPLADALSATIEDEPLGGFRNVVEDVINQVQGGQEFSKALDRHPKVFPSFFSNIIRASEASGLLGTMLQRIATYMISQRETKKKIIHAMAYPTVMVILCMLIAAFLVLFLLPKFARIFATQGGNLPAPTQVLMDIGDFTMQFWYLILLALAGTICGVWYFRRTSTGYKAISWLKINTPIIGRMFRQAYITRCMRTMGTLIDSGVSMLDTVDITKNIVDNYYYLQVLNNVDAQLQKGNLLSESLKDTMLFPHSVVQMMMAGERAGQIGLVMNRVADFCERDLDNAVQSTTKLIEPALVVFMGIFIGGVEISLLLPIFSLPKVMAGGGS